MATCPGWQPEPRDQRPRRPRPAVAAGSRAVLDQSLEPREFLRALPRAEDRCLDQPSDQAESSWPVRLGAQLQ